MASRLDERPRRARASRSRVPLRVSLTAAAKRQTERCPAARPSSNSWSAARSRAGGTRIPQGPHHRPRVVLSPTTFTPMCQGGIHLSAVTSTNWYCATGGVSCGRRPTCEATQMVATCRFVREPAQNLRSWTDHPAQDGDRRTAAAWAPLHGPDTALRRIPHLVQGGQLRGRNRWATIQVWRVDFAMKHRNSLHRYVLRQDIFL